MMVVVNMNLMAPKVIRREVYLWSKGPFGLSKDLEPEKCPNT
jgi:hypothetical protein